jgi:hypothetical protein
MSQISEIAYAKVKTDKVDSHTLAQLLRMDYTPVAHKVSNDKRQLRDASRARIMLVQRHTSITNFMQLLLAKYNFDSPTELSGIPKFQYEQLSEVEALLNDQMLDLEKPLFILLLSRMMTFSGCSGFPASGRGTPLLSFLKLTT